MRNSSRNLQSFRFPVLLADIGGTNTRFALLEDETAEITNLESVPTGDFPDLGSAIEETVIKQTSISPMTAVIDIAGPIRGSQIPLTNNDWVVEPNRIIEELEMQTILALNDFEALALSLPSLGDDEIVQVGGGEVKENEPKCILGPGTGLGMAAMVHVEDFWVPLPGEGGHIELGPFTDGDYQLWQHLPKTDGRIGAETVLSGPGILRIAEAVSKLDGVNCSFSTSVEVTKAADQGDELARRALRVFCRSLGRVAGDQALMLLARGGVYIAGGVSTIIRDYILDGTMREAFENKAPHKSILQEIPIFLIEHQRPAILGLASLARNPSSFAVELDGRFWSSK